MKALLNKIRDEVDVDVDVDVGYYDVVKSFSGIDYYVGSDISALASKPKFIEIVGRPFMIMVFCETEKISKKIMKSFTPKQDYFINCPDLYNWYNTQYRKVFEVFRREIKIKFYGRFTCGFWARHIETYYKHYLSVAICKYEKYLIPKLIDDYIHSVLLVDITNKENLPGDVTLNIIEFIGSQI